MEEILIGTRIRNRRKELNISQEELCDRICAVSTLSRIENNEQIPSRSTAKDLLERLGLSSDLLAAMVSQKETALWALIREIRNDMIQCRRMPVENRPAMRAEIREKLEKLEKMVKPEDYTAQQFLLSCRARLGISEEPYSAEKSWRCNWRPSG